ncbi:MAG TPA: type II/IV secretion system ATPase subunit [Thermoplasmata archaeon]|nr:type II/IV secretion system ATPase subunit [Thermoplasmata archaeon]
MKKVEAPLYDTLENAMQRNHHLWEYVRGFEAVGKRPAFITSLDRGLTEEPQPNFIYPLGDPLFIHIYKTREGKLIYQVIEPKFADNNQELRYNVISDKLLELSAKEKVPETERDTIRLINKLFVKCTRVVGRRRVKGTKYFKKFVPITTDEKELFKYFLKRDIIGLGRIMSPMRDPNLEDVTGLGPRNITVYHKLFGLMHTNVEFKGAIDYLKFVLTLSDKVGKTVSERTPIVDGTLPDGSRLNLVYSPDISLKGPSFCIRKFAETPISLTQIIQWGTFSSEIVAYLWLCIEYGKNIFFTGESASGKTTTLNSLLPLIPTNAKVFTAEDTAEVLVPHKVWQRMLTREREGGGSVTLFDILKAALRSRPNYLIVGEIRGAEGAIAFQTMQAGTPVMSTFHCASVRQLVQRISGTPINVPIAFVDNLNVVLTQQAIYGKGTILRRCLGVDEIVGYDRNQKGIITRRAFDWDSARDKFTFRAYHNSYILEAKVAPSAGLEDPREVYEQMDLRTRIIEEMVARKIFNYYEINEVLKKFYKCKQEGAPFTF